MARPETSHAELITLALDKGADEQRRRDAISALALVDAESALKTLIAVRCDVSAPPSVQSTAGRSLAQYCYRRLTDIDDLVMAEMTEAADEAYDAEIARLLALNPDSVMKRGAAGSGR